jgi:4-hydroxybenzoate polyprenyltransferase
LLQQDKDDDVKVGVKSTALRFGSDTKYWTSGFGLACISSLALSGYNADLGMFQLIHIYVYLFRFMKFQLNTTLIFFFKFKWEPV